MSSKSDLIDALYVRGDQLYFDALETDDWTPLDDLCKMACWDGIDTTYRLCVLTITRPVAKKLPSRLALLGLIPADLLSYTN